MGTSWSPSSSADSPDEHLCGESLPQTTDLSTRGSVSVNTSSVQEPSVDQREGENPGYINDKCLEFMNQLMIEAHYFGIDDFAGSWRKFVHRRLKAATAGEPPEVVRALEGIVGRATDGGSLSGDAWGVDSFTTLATLYQALMLCHLRTTSTTPFTTDRSGLARLL